MAFPHCPLCIWLGIVSIVQGVSRAVMFFQLILKAGQYVPSSAV